MPTAENEVDVIISEVGPRDGLQGLSRCMPTDAKKRWIRALAQSGLREIEVGSFVSPKRLPQMADTAQVASDAISIDGLTVQVLVPNLRGAMAAVEAGVKKIAIPPSASHQHCLSNLGKTPLESIAEVARICAWRNDVAPERRPLIEASISCAFGCAIEGAIAEAWVMAMAEGLIAAGADSVGLSDTTGCANPSQVKRMFNQLRGIVGDKLGGAHFHNTRGQGLANVVSALDAGITTFDSSLAGLGGCPYAPGSTGNIVTEDLVFLLESMGLRTGVDLNRLIGCRQHLHEALPGEPLHGHLAVAGVPKGFVPTSEGRLS